MVSPPPAPRFAARLAGVGLVVFLANAGLLVLQLVAGKLLSPFVGSSLSTWTVVIAAFLTGIAFGNAIGGRIADRVATPGKLVQFLIFGAISALWMIALTEILQRTGSHRSLELEIRIPVLAFALCFPAGFTLSLLTPMAIRICVPDVQHTGSVSGLVFALGTLGCLLGNYLTGFELIPRLELNWIVAGVAGLLILTAAVVYAAVRNNPPRTEAVAPGAPAVVGPSNSLPLRLACVIVFACSFAGMSLELSAVRLLAPVLGVSLFTWTGVIGVMLAGTALGNFVGGRLADRASRSGQPDRMARSLGWSLLFCGLTTVLVILAFVVLQNAPIFGIPTEPNEQRSKAFSSFGIIERVLAWTFALFFLPMLGLGLISPQAIRSAVPDVGSVGRVAGTVYAWSIAGAIAGTFATGYVLISSLGVNNTILSAAALPCAALLLVRVGTLNPGTSQASGRSTPLILDSGPMLYALAATLGAVFGGFVLSFQQTRGGATSDGIVVNALLETNYYTIQVSNADTTLALVPPTTPLHAVVGMGLDPQRQFYRDMILDNLRHSQVNMQDPTYLHYKHEHFQLEIVRLMKERTPEKQSVLVIGGGGYTFPRCTRVLIPTASVDVVEIDPGVTRMAKEQLGLIDEWKIRSIHMDGRQFVAEKAQPGTYDLVTLDAVNDLSVPSHLMTMEFNESVKKTLSPGGVYLVTVIDLVETGQLWKAAAHTLRESFRHVEMVFPTDLLDENDPPRSARSVIVLYASDAPFDAAKLRAATVKQTGQEPKTQAVTREIFDSLLAIDGSLDDRLARKLNEPDRVRVAAKKADWLEYRRRAELQGSLEWDRGHYERRKGEMDEAERLDTLAKLILQERENREKLPAYRGKWAEYTRLRIELAGANSVPLGKTIILTDQFSPTDNLMMDVFKKR